MKSKCLLLVLVVIGSAYSFQTSSESANPFNQFMSPSGGVNLYSGDVAFSHPVVTLEGRGGLSASVNLSYSSNVYLNVRARNDIAPAGWVGLGWRLSYGGIQCNHKGTKTHEDDEFMWISPTGVASKILKKDDKYFIEDDPYTKIVPQDINQDGVYDGWIVTGIDGKKMKYGNLDFTDNRKATRWTFAWGNYVGMGSAGNPVRYPYQWDLSEVSNLAGNALKYYYQQESEHVRVGEWLSPVEYTKASYPAKIVTPEGKRLEFELESKGDEAYDPYTFSNEPDGFMELYEDSMLSQIKVYNNPLSVEPIAKHKFIYGIINADHLGCSFEKSILNSIESSFRNVENPFEKVSFNYNIDYEEENSDYNYGSLKSIGTGKGKKVFFNYQRYDLDIPKTKDAMNTVNNSAVYANVTSDGQPYVVVREGAKKDLFYIYMWNGSQWVDFPRKKPFGSYEIDVYTDIDYFAVRGGEHKDLMKVYRWNGESWNEGPQEKPLATHRIELFPNGDHIAILGGAGLDLIKIYSWKNSTWNMGEQQKPFGNQELWITPGLNCFAVRGGEDKDLLKLFIYNGETWEWGEQQKPLATHQIDIIPGPNYFAVRGGRFKDLFKIYRFDGIEWKWGKERKPLATHEIELFSIGNHIAVKGGEEKDLMIVYTWTGNKWTPGKIEKPMATHEIRLYPGNDYIAVRGGSERDLINIYQWNGVDWNWVWETPQKPLATHQIDIWPGHNMVPVRGGKYGDLLKVYVYNGLNWNLKYDGKPVAHKEDIFLATGKNIIAARGHDEKIVSLFYRFQDEFEKPIYTFCVSNKSVEPGVRNGINILFNYKKSSANYDTRAGTAKFNEVEVINPGIGKTIRFYFNDTEADGQDSIQFYEKLDGMIYRTETFEESGQNIPLTISNSLYTTYSDEAWPNNVYVKRLVKTTSHNQGVKTVAEKLYNNSNGQPYLNITEKSGKKLLSKTSFAFENDAYSSVMGPDGAHMLSQPCQSIVYEKDIDDNSIEPLPTEIRSANATTWSNNLGCAAWVPQQSYVWEANYDSDGNLDRTFFDFDHSENAHNPDWKLTLTNDKYNTSGIPVQTSDPNGLTSANLLSNDHTMGFASAQNAMEGEIFFTSFEEELIWTPNVSGEQILYTTERAKTGNRSGQIINTGSSEVYFHAPWKELDESNSETQEYTFSGWVYTTGPQAEIFFFASVNGPSYEPGNYTNIVTPADAANKWVFLQKTFEAPVNAKYFTIRVDNNGKVGEQTNVYFDDLKFYPSDAYMTVNFYDEKWRKPIISVDANENPSNLVEYDEFGRQEKIWKVDKYKDVNDADYKKALLKSTEYHLMNSNP